MATRKVDRLLAWLWPFRCVLCGAPATDMDLCEGCRQDLPWIRAACRYCGIALPEAACGDCCGRCLTAKPPFDYCMAALRYEYPVDRLITGLKYHQRMSHARVLAELLVAGLLGRGSEPAPPDIVVPVPLHRRRVAARGFNQAEEIGRFVAAAIGATLDTRSCRRLRHTPEQTGLQSAERRRNLRGAFAVRRPLRGLRVALLDDVITTGSTAGEICKALRQAGAAEIQVWAVARAMR